MKQFPLIFSAVAFFCAASEVSRIQGDISFTGDGNSSRFCRLELIRPQLPQDESLTNFELEFKKFEEPGSCCQIVEVFLPNGQAFGYFGNQTGTYVSCRYYLRSYPLTCMKALISNHCQRSDCNQEPHNL